MHSILWGLGRLFKRVWYLPAATTNTQDKVSSRWVQTLGPEDVATKPAQIQISDNDLARSGPSAGATVHTVRHFFSNSRTQILARPLLKFVSRLLGS